MIAAYLFDDFLYFCYVIAKMVMVVVTFNCNDGGGGRERKIKVGMVFGV